MFAKIILSVVLILLICSGKLSGQYGGYIFSSFKDKDGLPDTKILDVKEDKDGYIWVKTWNGVCFFDGRKFYNVELNEEESSKINEGASKINQLFYELADGSIWISNNRNSLLEYDKFQNQYTGKSIDTIGIVVHIRGQYMGNSIFHKIHENSYFYIDSLKYKRDVQFEVFKNGERVKNYDIIEIHDDMVLCGHENQIYSGVADHSGKDTVSINLIKPLYSDTAVVSGKIVFQDAQVMTLKGTTLDTILDFGEFSELKNKEPSKLLLNNNDLWIYIAPSQLLICDIESGDILEIPPRLWNYQINSLFRDRSGNVWLSTSSLMRAEKSNTWNLYQSNIDTIVDERIFIVLKDRKGRVWAGGTDGKVFSYDSNFRLDKILKIPYTKNIKNKIMSRHPGRFFGMTLDEKDALWVSLKGDFNLSKINTNNFEVETQKIRTISEISDLQKILRTIFIQNENIWIGSYGALFRLKSGDDTLSMFSSEHTSGVIWKILADQSKNLWMGTYCLREFNQEEETFTNYYLHPNSPRNEINYVFSLYLEPTEQFLWVGSFGGGLHRFNLETKEFEFDDALTEKDGLSDNIVYAIYRDKKDRLWLATMGGISCLELDDFSKVKTYTNFDLPADFEVNEINSEASYQDTISGEILLGGMKGVLGFYPDTLISMAKNAQLNPIFIHNVKSGGKLLSSSLNINETNRIDLPKGDNQIEFDFVSPGSSPVNIQYRYRMEGIDEDWDTLKGPRHISYNNLDEGTYTFKIQAQLFNQPWENNRKELEINIKKFFWQTTKFKIIVGLLVLSLAAYIVFLRFKNLILKKDAQEKEIEKQTAILHSLGTQMNPHFLYNSLNSINNFIINNDERKANEYLSDFASLMRKILNNSKFEKIPLANELECIGLYVKLEQLRLSNGFIFNIKLAPDIAPNDIYIPPMLIQPFVENAIWHGIRHINKKGILELTILRENQNIVCHITDNGVGITKSRQINGIGNDKKSTGIHNIKKRLKILNEIYDNNLELKIRELVSNGVVKGTQVTISISQMVSDKE